MRFLALVDKNNEELSYYGYSRQRLEGYSDWEIIQFSRYTGEEPIEIVGCWSCDSPTSDLHDGIPYNFLESLVLKPGEFPNIHVRDVK